MKMQKANIFWRSFWQAGQDAFCRPQSRLFIRERTAMCIEGFGLQKLWQKISGLDKKNHKIKERPIHAPDGAKDLTAVPACRQAGASFRLVWWYFFLRKPIETQWVWKNHRLLLIHWCSSQAFSLKGLFNCPYQRSVRTSICRIIPAISWPVLTPGHIQFPECLWRLIIYQ